MAITALLNSAYATTDIILIQEANITDPKYEVTQPNLILVRPPKGRWRSNRTAAYISRCNPHLHITQRMDICNDLDLQILEVATDRIPPFLLLNIYNENDTVSKLYTVPQSLTPLPLPSRCVITGDLNAYQMLWNSQITTP
jgi:hypothetical protein